MNEKEKHRSGNRHSGSKIKRRSETTVSVLDETKVKAPIKDRSKLQRHWEHPGKKKINEKDIQKASCFSGKNGPIRKHPISRVRKPTGELQLFKSIYEARGPNSQIAPFRWIAFDVRCFSHILTKGAYPAFRLYEKNIVLKTPEEHHLWETARHKLKNLPEWTWIFKLEQELKREYYDNTRL